MKVVNEPTQLMLRNLQEQTRRRHAAGQDSPFKASLKFRESLGADVPEAVINDLVETGIRIWAEKTIHEAGSEALDLLKKMQATWNAQERARGQTETSDICPFLESVLATWFMSLDFEHISEHLVAEFITNADSPVAPDMDLPMAQAVSPRAQDPTIAPSAVLAQLLRKMTDPSAN